MNFGLKEWRRGKPLELKLVDFSQRKVPQKTKRDSGGSVSANTDIKKLLYFIFPKLSR